MKLKQLKCNLPLALLSFMAARVPFEAVAWAEAIIGELQQIPSPCGRLRWALSGSLGLGRIWVHSCLQPPLHDAKPVPILLISLYHAVFSFALMAVLIRQLRLIQPPTSEAFVPVLFAFFVASIPAVIALGFWVLDDAARIMAIVFSVIHAVGNFLWLSQQNDSWKPFSVGRLVLDLVMIGVLMLPPIRRAFQPAPVKLELSA
jgi:hypothetical protein